ncbi:helix-turn-helix domain-containing protein [Rhodococcus erythropolis]|nr:helix-turn-helix domain-containing protein [Rhodococcus erythropolis]
MVKSPDDRTSLAKPPEMAEYLGKTVQGLAVWRTKGMGPKFIKFENGSIRYRWSDVDAWLSAQEVGGAA